MKTNPNLTILAIDTSCDETSAAVTSGLRILSNVIASQVEIHKKYGGVYPTEAKRAHLENIDPVVREALKRAQAALRRNLSINQRLTTQRPQFTTLGIAEIDAIAVTVGPGLAPALEVGIAKAKQLASQFQKPLIAVNHMEGHLLSPLGQNSHGKGSLLFERTPRLLKGEGGVEKSVLGKHTQFSTGSNSKIFPALSLLVSGGHTQLVLINSIGDYQLLGETRDDAAGECFDKVARLLNLGYPGGPIISQLARVGDASAYQLPIPMKDDLSLDFSFSGLKTASKYFLQQHPLTTRSQIQNFCASFQTTVVNALLLKTEAAINLHHPQSLWLGGGVGANWQLRRELQKLANRHRLPLFTPYTPILYTDNAAMIGIAAYFKGLQEDFVKDLNSLDRLPNLSF